MKPTDRLALGLSQAEALPVGRTSVDLGLTASSLQGLAAHLDVAHRFTPTLAGFGGAYVTPRDVGAMLGLRGIF